MPVLWDDEQAPGSVLWDDESKPPLPPIGEIGARGLARGLGQTISGLATSIPDIVRQQSAAAGLPAPPQPLPYVDKTLNGMPFASQGETDPTTLAARVGNYGRNLIKENPAAITEPGQLFTDPLATVVEATTESLPLLASYIANPGLGAVATALTSYGGTRERQRTLGIDEPGKAAAAGALAAGLERFGVERYLPGGGGLLPAKASRLLEAGKGAAAGAAIEAGTEVPTQIAETYAGGDDPLSQEALKSYALGLVKGAAGGAPLGALRGIAEREPTQRLVQKKGAADKEGVPSAAPNIEPSGNAASVGGKPEEQINLSIRPTVGQAEQEIISAQQDAITAKAQKGPPMEGVRPQEGARTEEVASEVRPSQVNNRPGDLINAIQTVRNEVPEITEQPATPLAPERGVQNAEAEGSRISESVSRFQPETQVERRNPPGPRLFRSIGQAESAAIPAIQEAGTAGAVAKIATVTVANPTEPKAESGIFRPERLEENYPKAAEKLSGWKNAPDVQIYDSPKDAPFDASDDAEGTYYDGRVHLFKQNLADDDDAVKVLLHETVGHRGLRGTLGDGMDPFLDRVVRERSAEIRRLMQDLGVDDRTAAEEFMADMAKTGTDRGFLDRSIVALNTAMRKVFPKLKLSRPELREVLVRSRRRSAVELSAPRNSAQDANAADGSAVTRGAETDAEDLPTLRNVVAEDLPTEPSDEPRSVGAAENVGNVGGVPEFLSNAAEGGLETFRQISRVGAKSVSYLDKAAKSSPTLARLREEIEHSDLPGKGTSQLDFNERVSLAIGGFMRRYDEAKKSTAPDKYRALFDDIRKYANDAGLDLGYIKGYFQRVWDTKALSKPVIADAFLRKLSQYGIDVSDAYTMLSNITAGDGVLTPGSAGRVTLGIIPPEMHRTLAQIPDAELAPFLKGGIDKNGVPQRPDEVIPKYIGGVVRRAEYARTFGKDNEKLNKMVSDIVTESIQSGRPLAPSEQKRIFDLAEVLAGTYGRISDGWARKINDWLVTTEYMITLPLSALANISEPILAIERGGAKNAIKAIPATLNQIIRQTARIAFKGVDKAQITKDIEELGIATDESIAQMTSEMFGTEGVAGKVQGIFFKWNLMTPVTRMTQALAAKTAENMIKANLVKQNRRKVQELKDLGLDPVKGAAWAKGGFKRGDPYFKSVQAAQLRFVNDLVLQPRGTTKPLYMSNPKARLFTMLKGYFTVAANTIGKRMLYKVVKGDAVEKARVAGTLAVYIAATFLLREFRDWAIYGDEGNPYTKNLTVQEKAWRSFLNTGLLGPLKNYTEALKQGFNQSEALFGAAAPIAGQALKLSNAAQQAYEGNDKKLKREAFRMIPIAGAFAPRVYPPQR